MTNLIDISVYANAHDITIPAPRNFTSSIFDFSGLVNDSLLSEIAFSALEELQKRDPDLAEQVLTRFLAKRYFSETKINGTN
jgi:hypothetical protein